MYYQEKIYYKFLCPHSSDLLFLTYSICIGMVRIYYAILKLPVLFQRHSSSL